MSHPTTTNAAWWVFLDDRDQHEHPSILKPHTWPSDQTAGPPNEKPSWQSSALCLWGFCCLRGGVHSIKHLNIHRFFISMILQPSLERETIQNPPKGCVILKKMLKFPSVQKFPSLHIHLPVRRRNSIVTGRYHPALETALLDRWAY